MYGSPSHVGPAAGLASCADATRADRGALSGWPSPVVVESKAAPSVARSTIGRILFMVFLLSRARFRRPAPSTFQMAPSRLQKCRDDRGEHGPHLLVLIGDGGDRLRRF